MSADIFSEEQRSYIMSRVSSKNTKPELYVRSFLHGQGLRFRIHRKDLPGKPDLALPKYRTAIFVHGCFWHRHKGCSRATMPSTRIDFWERKFERNVVRDKANQVALREEGWKVLVVWECELSNIDKRMCSLPKLIREIKED